jgi:predicted RNA-binding protein YlxR (DUF448 family)
MVRVVKTMNGLAIDLGQRMPGRGAYVHRDATCATRAVRQGGLARTLRCEVPGSFLESFEGPANGGEDKATLERGAAERTGAPSRSEPASNDKAARNR